MERREMLAAGVAGLAVLGAGVAHTQAKDLKEGSAVGGGPPLSANTALLLLVDHQVGLFSLVGDYTPDEFRNNVLALAGCGKTFNLPTILTMPAIMSCLRPVFLTALTTPRCPKH